MKRVAIVTIESLNYGNRLQNYALQQVLRSLGYSVKTLHRIRRPNGIKAGVKHFLQDVMQTKAAKFRQFDTNIDFSEIIIGPDNYPEDIQEKFDYFVSGSDQVWNPHYEFVGTSDLLAFAKPEQRISYAASFGVDEIPESRMDVYRQNLAQFKAISVREEKGAEMLHELIGRSVQVVLDPTMLLTSAEWKKAERKPKCAPKGKYVLVYSLGGKSEEFEKEIRLLSDEYEIFDIRSVQNSGREIPVGPAEFLYLIHYSEMILTDSFHATVFASLYHKKFITFRRPGLNMNSRIVSLAKVIDAEDYLDEHGNLKCSNGLNYAEVDQRIENERLKSKVFLKKALED